MNWIFEPSVFQNGDVLFNTIKVHDEKIYIWDDLFYSSQYILTISNPCIFHGSLNIADFINKNTMLFPGSFCSTEKFQCSYWYEYQKSNLLNSDYVLTTIAKFIDHQQETLEKLNFSSKKIFVRPNSPLKPFSGRVLDVENINLLSFDYGFYYEDPNLEIIISTSKDIQKEWRLVIIGNRIVTGCEYDPKKHIPVLTKLEPEVYKYAQKIVDTYKFDEKVYVMDICESNGKYYLLEYNPFGGADLYLCNGEEIYQAIVTEFGLTTAST